MLTKYELNEISVYLIYLAQGIDDNGLSKNQIKKIMDLSYRCTDIIDAMDEIEDRLY